MQKLAEDDPQRSELLKEADHRETALLCELIELPLFGKAMEVKPHSTATGSRKSAAEPQVTPLQRRTDEAAAECVRTMKIMDMAQRAQKDAKKTYATKARVYDNG